MSINVTGIVAHKGMGTGTWALVTESGETYELKNTPTELQKSDLKVKVEGEIKEDVMTLAMVGPVLEVKAFEVLE